MDLLKEKADMRKDLIIAVDIGGTKMHSVLMNTSGSVLAEHRIQHKKQSPDDHFNDLVQLIEITLHDGPCSNDNTAICIGVNSPVTGEDGMVVWAPALGWKNRPIGLQLRKKFSVPVKIENDANLACLGEWYSGAGKGFNNIVSIFLGTGIGAGIILDGKLYSGARGCAGEMGRMPINQNSLHENRHSGFGALESVSSGLGIEYNARKHLEEMNIEPLEISAEAVISACLKGEEWAVKTIENSLDYLAIAIAQIICLLDPEVIIIGGGVANAFSVIGPLLRERLVSLIPHVPDLKQAKLGPLASAFGALSCYQ